MTPSDTAFDSVRQRLRASIDAAGFHPHPSCGPAADWQVRAVRGLVAEGLVPRRYDALARKRALDIEEAAQLIEAGERQRAYAKRGRKVPFRPCETRRATKARIAAAVR